MTTPAGRPNISNIVLDKDGRFTPFWYRFIVQIWERSGGSEDDVSNLFGQVNLVGLKASSQTVEKGDLSPSIINRPEQGNLVPVIQQISQASLSDLAPV